MAEGYDINPPAEGTEVNTHQAIRINLSSQEYPPGQIRNEKVFDARFGDFHP
jgi:hypothetical protein